VNIDMTEPGDPVHKATSSMKSESLDDLASRHGIGDTRPSPDGTHVAVTAETKRKVMQALGVDPADLKPREASSGGGSHPPDVAAGVIPASYIPPFLDETRVWGVTIEPYALRSSRNWGIGDFVDLEAVAGLFGRLGADFIGLTPLHAPFLADPDRRSPYEPSSRQRLNPLYIAVDRVSGYQPDPDLEQRAAKLRETAHVDYVGVAQLKLNALRNIWTGWSPVDDEAEDFTRFTGDEGEPLRLHALFETLSLAMAARGLGAGWQVWPEPFRDPTSADVAAFAEAHEDEIQFHTWLQWLAHSQLRHAADAARSAGLRIGLYLDLAVGEALDGSATWGERENYVSAATVGSPPDPFAAEGQDWHLAAFQPSAIARGNPSPYRRMVTAAMRYAGAIRIDHAAALRRLFLVPLDLKPDGGAYVAYPQEALLATLAEASAEHECLVIGEDLGVLPDGLQDDLSQARILSYRILSYERTEEGFKPAGDYPALSLACISTHDHQTLAGWWRGADIATRAEHGILPPEITQTHHAERKVERQDLARALDEAGLEQPAGLPPVAARDTALRPLVVDAHRFIARTPSMLAAVRLADMTGEQVPTNVPGTSDSYPNWKPKLSLALEELADARLLQAIATAMQEERPRP
jgi:4-alpha-glucanotransferase